MKIYQPERVTKKTIEKRKRTEVTCPICGAEMVYEKGGGCIHIPSIDDLAYMPYEELDETAKLALEIRSRKEDE